MPAGAEEPMGMTELAEQSTRGDVEADGKTPEEKRPVQLAVEGIGPLLQRDYLAVVRDSPMAPEDVLMRMRTDFPRFSPDALARFTRPEGETGPLQLGQTMHVFITGVGHCAVQVSHLDVDSFTLRTLHGHMEAGRITFSATCSEAGFLEVRIRSRARISDVPRLLSYLMLGRAVQTKIWTTFLERVAEATGGRLLGSVTVATDHVQDSLRDLGIAEGPTLQIGSGA